MSELPLVSICIPIYNGQKYLEETLLSAFNQTYPRVEIIISDDKSSDNSLLVVEKSKTYNTKNWNIKVYSHERLGLVKNWNFCLQNVSGEYIKFLFQDDVLHSTCVEEMVALAEKNPQIGMVFSSREIILEENMTLHPDIYILHKFWGDLQLIQSGISLVNRRVIVTDPLNKIGEPTNVLIRKKVFDSIGYFDCNIMQMVDWEMWLRIMSNYDIGFIDKTLSKFRIHPYQTTNTNAELGRGWDDIFKIWLKVLSDASYRRINFLTRINIKFNLIKRLSSMLVRSLLHRKNNQTQILFAYMKKALKAL
jgi:glycosyltransferase involved in cell wall biosynthesis